MATHEEIDERVPCPDGACTGLIGADHRCGTCGREGPAPAPDGPREEVAPPDATAAAESEPPTPAAGLDDVPAAPPRDDAAALDERAPCPDGTCVGILGADGRCGTCGCARRAPGDVDR